MAEALVTNNPAVRSDAHPAVATPFLVDTTEASPLHRLGRSRTRNTTGALRAYLLAVSATYIPLVVAALFSRNPLTATSAVRLPFFRDWNTAFSFLVAFPTLVAVVVTDQHALTSALFRVQRDGIVTLPEATARDLADTWRRRFRRVNIAGYVSGVVVGVAMSFVTYLSYSSPRIGYWMAYNGSLEPVGVVVLYGVFLLYGLMPLCVIRNVMMSLLLHDIVSRAPLRMFPFHPDKCGGLRPIGSLGLRNQYVLTVFGLNLAALATISGLYLTVDASLYGYIVSASVAYFVLGPIVFMGPLLSFRRGMLLTKATLLSEVAVRLRLELQRLRKELSSGQITKEDEDLIDRLRKVGAVIDELPVWPFDPTTLRKFLTAYVMPLAGALGYPAIKALLTLLAAKVGHPSTLGH